MMHSIHSALAVAFLFGLSAAQAPAEYQYKATSTLYSTNGLVFAPGAEGPPIAQSPHFAYHGPPGLNFDKALNDLEMSYRCFVTDLGWKSTGASFRNNQPGLFKTNFYQVQSFTGASVAGQMYTDSAGGRGYCGVGTRWVEDALVTIHEYGHVLHLHERTWQSTNARPWWETLASFVADYALHGEGCADARAAFSVNSTRTNMDFNAIVSNAHQIIVTSQGGAAGSNVYKAWPFFTYLTNNPDQYPTLGRDTVRNLFRQWTAPETPLHTLAKVAGPDLSVQTIVASYWARVAYMDMWHASAASAFNRAQLGRRGTVGPSGLNYANVDPAGDDGAWRVKPERAPRYMGASFVPIAGGDGPVEIRVVTTTAAASATGQQAAAAAFEARVAIRAENYGAVRYAALVDGRVQLQVAPADEVMLVVVNAPAALIDYNPARPEGSGADQGLDYTVYVTGAQVGSGAAPQGATGVRRGVVARALGVDDARDEHGFVTDEYEDELAHAECGGEVGRAIDF